jgi:hypothetical protein
MTINDTVAKKLGEVLAFNRVGQDTIDKGRAVLTEVLGAERIEDMEEKFRIHGEGILKFATENAVIDTVLRESSAHEEEFKKIRELYIGDNWNSAGELLEWSGWFEGAAIVHWAFIFGAAQALGDEELMTFAEEGKNYRYELLELAESELEAKGQDKATQ